MRMGMCHCGTGRSAERGARADGDSIRTGNRSRRPSGRLGDFAHIIRPFVHRRRLPPQHARDSPSRPVNQNHAPERKRAGLQKPKTAAPREGQRVCGYGNARDFEIRTPLFHTAGSSHSEAERLGLRYWYAYFAYAHISVWGAQKLSAFSSHPRDWGIRRTNQRSINRRFKSSAASCNRAHRFAWIHRL